MPKDIEVHCGGDDELRMAARAGLLLLEKNAALEVDVELLTSEIHRYESQHRELSLKVDALINQRKSAVLEVQAAYKEIRGLQNILQQERSTWRLSEQSFTFQIRNLTAELNESKLLMKEETNNQNEMESLVDEIIEFPMEDPQVSNLMEENDMLKLQLNEVLQEMSEAQITWSQSANACNQRIQTLEHEVLKLTRENKTLKEEQAEERELIESLRTMVQTYKKIADSRPFAADPQGVEEFEELQDDSSSMHENLMEANAALELRVKELETQVHTQNMTQKSTDLDAHVMHLEEQLNVTKEMLKHTKQQWISAVTAKKEAQECTLAAHQEMERLQEALQVKLMSEGSETSVEWMTDTTEHPAPPGDLHSPLIGCLLNHWTSDKTKVEQLVQWLHGAIQGNPTQPKARLDSLSTEVTAGFIQLMVPLLREAHGVHVKVQRRTSIHVLSDLILTVDTDQPSKETLYLVS